MKSIAVEDSTYAKLSKLKAEINSERNLHMKFSDLFEELIRRSTGLYLFESELRSALKSLTERLSNYESVLGIILFGSVAKLNFNPNSDIDVFVLVDKFSSSTFDYIEKIMLSVEMNHFEPLIENKLPSQFSPFICSKDTIQAVSPIFFDIADYGIVLYDKGTTASDFVRYYLSIHHSREFNEYGQILTW